MLQQLIMYEGSGFFLFVTMILMRPAKLLTVVDEFVTVVCLGF